MKEEAQVSDTFEFQVGEKYTNEKGVFQVLSIDRGDMVIRWEDGKEVRSSVALQLQIQKRRGWEKWAREKNASIAAGKTHRGSKPNRERHFGGLQRVDFMDKISTTKWRGREQLGGAVTHQLPGSPFHFNSWAAKGQNEVQWEDADIRKQVEASRTGRFFARADETSFSWGFSIERPGTGSDPSSQWKALIDWLYTEEGDHWLRTVVLEEGLDVYHAQGSPSEGAIPFPVSHPGEDQTGPPTPERLAEAIEAGPGNERAELRIAKRISREDAIARKDAIGADLAGLFGRLLPLYEAAAGRME